MVAKIRFKPIATADLQDIKEYLSEENAAAAVKTIRDIISNVETLADFPKMGSPLTSRMRQKSNYRYLDIENQVLSTNLCRRYCVRPASFAC